VTGNIPASGATKDSPLTAVCTALSNPVPQLLQAVKFLAKEPEPTDAECSLIPLDLVQLAGVPLTPASGRRGPKLSPASAARRSVTAVTELVMPVVVRSPRRDPYGLNEGDGRAMTTSSTTQPTSKVTARLVPAVTAGIIGGLVFGVLMQLTGMIPMVAILVGSKSMVIGWLVHLAIAAFIGASFAVIFSRLATSIGRAALYGLGYGIVWWVLGALLIMSAKLGMIDMIFSVSTTQWQSLVGHLVYGLLLGVTFGLLAPRLARRGR
jgi:hypothetical protein